MVVSRRQRYVLRQPDEVWSLDFVADQLANGCRLRALTVVDIYSREVLPSKLAGVCAAKMSWPH